MLQEIEIFFSVGLTIGVEVRTGIALAVFCRGDLLAVLEIPAEIVYALKTNHFGNLADAGICVQQKILGLFQTDTVDVLKGRRVQRGLKGLDQRAFADVHDSGKIIQNDGRGQPWRCARRDDNP